MSIILTNKDVPRISTITDNLFVRHGVQKHHIRLCHQLDLMNYPLDKVNGIGGEQFGLVGVLNHIHYVENSRKFLLNDKGVLFRHINGRGEVNKKTFEPGGQVGSIITEMSYGGEFTVIENTYSSEGYLINSHDHRSNMLYTYSYVGTELDNISGSYIEKKDGYINIPMVKEFHLKSV